MNDIRNTEFTYLYYRPELKETCYSPAKLGFNLNAVFCILCLPVSLVFYFDIFFWDVSDRALCYFYSIWLTLLTFLCLKRLPELLGGIFFCVWIFILVIKEYDGEAGISPFFLELKTSKHKSLVSRGQFEGSRCFQEENKTFQGCALQKRKEGVKWRRQMDGPKGGGERKTKNHKWEKWTHMKNYGNTNTVDCIFKTKKTNQYKSLYI